MRSRRWPMWAGIWPSRLPAPAIIEGNDFPGTDLCQLAPFYPEKEGLWPYYKKLLHW